MTKKEILNKVKAEIEGIGLTWLGRRTRNYTEKLNVIFISTDLEMLGNPVESLLDAYGLSSYFAMSEDSDVVLIGVNREKLANSETDRAVDGLPKTILDIEDPDKNVRYTSVTMWASIDGGIRSLGSNTNIILNYQNFLADRYESGSLKKGDMINHVILHKTFEKYVLADDNFVKGVKNNSYSYWNMRKIMEYVNQQHVALFNDLSN
jgi:hypothetical protein